MSDDSGKGASGGDQWSGPPTEPLYPRTPEQPSVYESLYRPEPPTPQGSLPPAQYGSGPGPGGSGYGAPNPGQAHSPGQYQGQQRAGGTPHLLLGLGIGIIVTVLLGAGVVWFTTGGDERAQVADPTPAQPSSTITTPPTVHPAPQPSAPPTSASPPPTTREPSPSPTIGPFPSDAEVCPVLGPAQGPYLRSAAGTSATSCEFAEQVREAYGTQSDRGDGVTIHAWSPVTGQSYEMSCSGDGMVTCRGGNNAVVHLGR